MDIEAAQEQTNLPGIAMLVLGIINVLFWLAWIGWAIFGLAMGGLGVLMTLPAVLENGDIVSGLLSVWGPLITTCTCGVNVFLLIGAALQAFGGLKLRSVSGAGTVKLGIAASVIGPIISILLGVVAALAAFNCCGLVFGQLPTILVLVLNAGVGGWAWMTMSDDDVAAAFEANDG